MNRPLRFTFPIPRPALDLLRLLSCAFLLIACAPNVARHNNAGNQRFAAGDYDAAIAEYRQAQVDEPDRAEPYYNAANAFNRRTQLDAAVAQARQALKTADPELAAQTWYNLANAYLDAQQWSQAIEAYKEALRLNPDDGDSKHNLELALQKLQEQEQQEQQEEQQDQENQTSENGGPSETGQATPTPASQPETSEEGGQPTPDPSEAGQETEGMTQEQALQLLQALFGESKTLQERLQEIYRVPGPPPEQDW